MALTPGVNLDMRSVQRVTPVDQDGNAVTGQPGKSKLITATFTRPADTTQYAAGEVVGVSPAANITFANCARENGGSGLIIGAILVVSTNQVTKLSGELWLFDTAPAAVADNAAFNPADGEADDLIGIIPFQTAYVGGANCAYVVADIAIPFVCAAASKDLYGVLVARNAYTPTASEVFTVRLRIAQD